MHPQPLLLRHGGQALRSACRVAWTPPTASFRNGPANASPLAAWTRSYVRPGAAGAAPAQTHASAPATQQRRHASSPATSSSSAAPSLPVLPPSILAQALLPTAPATDAATAAAAAAAATATTTAEAEAEAAVLSASDATNAHPTVYATVLLHGRPYLVTPGDQVRLPFRMPGVRPGDELLLDRVGVVGSRTLTAVPAVAGGRTSTQGGPMVQQQNYVPGAAVRAVVLGLETEPLREKVKTKRRNRRSRRVHSKHQFTVLRIQEVLLSSAGAQTSAST